MYLGIDCGTQGTKALIIDGNGNALAKGYATHPLIERGTGAREQEPEWWITSLKDAVKQALSGIPSAEIRALGVSGQQHGLVVLDEAMHVIRPAKLWNDTETAPQNEDLVQRFGGQQAFFERFGIVPLTGYTVSKLLWLKEKEPENFAKIRHILLPHEFLNFWLTGNIFAEYGDASGTAFFDVRTRSWCQEILDEIDGHTGQLFRALPHLLRVDEVVGTLRPEVAVELGLNPTCIVSTGGGDNMMGAIGTGNIREGIVTLSLGTSCTVYSYRNDPALDPHGSVAPFCSSSGGWLPLVCTMNSTNVVTQTLQILNKTVDDIEPALMSTTPGADGLTFIPFLNGERTPDLPHARGSILGLSANNFTMPNLIRSVIEGVSYGILNGLNLILGDEIAERILVIGGGARSAAWRQLLADATGAIIQVPLEDEAACLGAAMQAIFIYGIHRGSPETFQEIAERCVKIDKTKTALPQDGMQQTYKQAIELYQQRLNQIYLVPPK